MIYFLVAAGRYWIEVGVIEQHHPQKHAHFLMFLGVAFPELRPRFPCTGKGIILVSGRGAGEGSFTLTAMYFI